MFALKYSKMLENSIFNKYGVKPVAEDYYRINNNVLCVADGITLDDINGNAVKYPETKEDVEKWVKYYPNPSGSYKAAKLICDTFIDESSKYNIELINKNIVEECIKKANKKLKTINDGREIDYLTDDFYCCEAVGGIIKNNTLCCFSIGDCHIYVLDKDFNIIFETRNNHKQFEDYLENIYMKQNDFDWDNPRDRVMVRKEYRNNPSQKYKGKEISYGALTGEKKAEYYIDTYDVDLSNAKYICAFSDGCEPFFENREKIKDLLNDIDNFEKMGLERTLIVYERIN